jgi:hypothetical protein
VAAKKKARPLVSLAEVLPPPDHLLTPEPQPPHSVGPPQRVGDEVENDAHAVLNSDLGSAQLYAALDQANIRHLELTDELRQLRSKWAKRNIEAQQTRIAIGTPEIKHVETRRRELHLALEQIQSEIGQFNKQIREFKSTRLAVRPQALGDPGRKQMPVIDDSDFPAYFVLSHARARAKAQRMIKYSSCGTEMAKLGTSIGDAWSVRKSSDVSSITWLDLDGVISAVANVRGGLGVSIAYYLVLVGLMNFWERQQR